MVGGNIKAFAPSHQIRQHSIHQVFLRFILLWAPYSALKSKLVGDILILAQELGRSGSLIPIAIDFMPVIEIPTYCLLVGLQYQVVCRLLEVIQYQKDQLEEEKRLQEDEEGELILIVLIANLE
ncbi:MAG: hypothetical protein EZS28_003207 [Streblomastix strix]|uniref:Uncharacterized protein n=1 Tax=Streblomastix strix TaxID=222440 RepID=A0A5J4X431_9EUKA|nr:MAG: hypothetical protein EZS28_003207 [Streblomastix strix]